jgi:hypothetical protein
MSFVTINTERQMFVLREHGGCSCLGFEVVRDRTRQYAALLGVSLPDPLPYATLDALRLYEDIEMRLARSPIARHLTIYDPNTPGELVTILERVRLSRTRIRLFYGDAQTGRDWNEENDVEGYLARTSGPIHCPILLKTNSSTGGGIILSASIVKLAATATKRTLWQHPAYHTLSFTISETPRSSPYSRDWPVEVLREGQAWARFRNHAKARRFIRRITGQ